MKSREKSVCRLTAGLNKRKGQVGMSNCSIYTEMARKCIDRLQCCFFVFVSFIELQKDLVCWTVEWLDVSWTSLSTNTKHCIFEKTIKILSATGKMVTNKLEKLSGMLCLAHNRIRLTVWHVGCSCYLYLSSVVLPSIFLSEHIDIVTFVVTFSKFLHLISHHFVTGQSHHMALEMLGVAGPWSMVSSPSCSMKEWGRRCQEKVSPCGLDSQGDFTLAFTTEFLVCDDASFLQYLIVSIQVSKGRFPEFPLLQVAYICSQNSQHSIDME